MKKPPFFALFVVALIVPSAWADYSGIVFADRNANGIHDPGEVPVAGVVVSDGLHAVKTDKNGRYVLPGHEGERFLFMTVPDGCKAYPFYRKIEDGKEQYDFALLPNKKGTPGKEHSFLHITDTEIFNTGEHEDWVNGLREYAEKTGASFVIHTGDICYEKGLKEHINLMNTGNFPCPVYYCIGNHDLVAGKYGEEVFENVYGPTFYSFDSGSTHYIVTPMLGGDRKPGYTKEDVYRWMKNDLALVPKGKPVIVFNHDILTTGDQFKYGIGKGEEIDLNAHNLKAWIYGHWHINHMRFQGEVFTMCTGTVDKGGIDHSTAAFRDIHVDVEGYPSSNLRYAYLDRAVHVASVQNGKSPLSKNGSLTVLVNAYHAGSPTKGVTCSLTVDGKKLPEVALSRRTDWNWSAEVPMPAGAAGKKVQLRTRVDFGHGLTVDAEENFICTPFVANPVRTGKPWNNLLGNPEHSGTVPGAPLPPYELAWVSNIGANVYMASPVVREDKVYVAAMDEDLKGRSGIYALDARTGELLWRYPTRNSVKNTIALDGDTVLAQDSDGYLYAIHGKTGMLRWEKKLNVKDVPGLIEGLVADKGIVYAGSGRGLTACSVKDGKELWKNSGWDQREGTTTTMSLGNGVLISGSQWQALFGNDAATGKLLWKIDRDGLRNRGASAAIHGDKAYITSQDGLFVLETATGNVLNHVKLPVSVDVTSTPLVTDQEIIFGSARDGLIALDRETLTEKWRHAPGDALVYTAPYTRKVSATIETSPVLAGDATVLATASDGSLTALDRKSGNVLWKAMTGAPFLSSPAISGNAVFVADFSGNVYALTPVAGK
jgi:outer membrane protein assembly factor BamB/predicted phosphodiesterase